MRKKITSYRLVWLPVFAVSFLYTHFQASAYATISGLNSSHKIETNINNLSIPASISGTVVDQDNTPIPGATVIVVGTNTGTVTDIDGKFNVDASPGQVIRISFIGFESAEVTVGNQTEINVSLNEDTSSLEEVVVVGYGTQRKSDLTGAISSVTSEDLKETPAGNFLE